VEIEIRLAASVSRKTCPLLLIPYSMHRSFGPVWVKPSRR